MAREVGRDLWVCTLSQRVFLQAQTLYPFLLLTAFGIAFAIHSVIASRHQDNVEPPLVLGPGGKPLPVTRIKAERSRISNATIPDVSHRAYLAFRIGTAGVTITFAYHLGYLIRQCVLADWEDLDRFCNEPLLVCSFHGLAVRCWDRTSQGKVC